MKPLEKLQQIRQQEQQTLKELESEILGSIDASYLKEICEKLDNTYDLTQVEYDEWFHQWVRIDLDRLAKIDFDDDDQVNALINVLDEHDCLRLDVKNECLTKSIGPSILINDDGDVLDQDSGKWIISKDDYENENELYNMIENHMDKTGYFPSVVRCDRYGNAFFVNTRGEK